jgi:hypothetical protein
MIAHGLGTLPSVTLLDDSRSEFEADTGYPDLNTVIVKLVLPMTGTTRLRA